MIRLARYQPAIETYVFGFTPFYTTCELEEKSYVFAKEIRLTNIDQISDKPNKYKIGFITVTEIYNSEIIDEVCEIIVTLYVGKNGKFPTVFHTLDYEAILVCIVREIERVQQYEETTSCIIF